MDSKAEVTTSGSPSFPIRAPPSYDSDSDNALHSENISDDSFSASKNSVAGSSSISSSSVPSSVSKVVEEDEEDGFVSGDEDFESASERPFVGEPDEETLDKIMEEEDMEDGDALFLETPEGPPEVISMPKTAMPIAKVSPDETDDDGDEVDVESPKSRSLGSELVENEVPLGKEKETLEAGGVVVEGNGDLVSKDANLAGGEEGSTAAVTNEIVEEVGLSKDIDSIGGEGSGVATVNGVAVEESLGDDGKIGENARLDDDDERVAAVPSEVDEEIVDDGDNNKSGESARLVDDDERVAAVPSEVNEEIVEDGDNNKAGESVRLVDDGERVAAVPSEVDEEIVEDGGNNKTGESARLVDDDEGVAAVPSEVDEEIVEDGEIDMVAGNVVVNGDLTSKGEGALALEKQQLQVFKLNDGDADEQKDEHSHGDIPVLEEQEVVSAEWKDRDEAEEIKDELSNGNNPLLEKPEVDQTELKNRNEAEEIKDELSNGKHEKETVIPINGHELEEQNDEHPDESKGSSAVNEVNVVSTVKKDENVTVDSLSDGNLGGMAIDTFTDQVHAQEGADSGELKVESKSNHLPVEIGGSVTDEDAEIVGSSEAAKQFLEELERATENGSHSGGQSYLEHADRVDGQIVTDSDEEVDTDDEGDEKELFDSDALAALLKAAANAGSDGGSVTITSQDGSRLFSVDRPAGLGSSAGLRPTRQLINPNPFAEVFPPTESDDSCTEDEKKKLEKLQLIRVKFLRLMLRLGVPFNDPTPQQVMYRSVLAAGRLNSKSFSVDAAKTTALQLEAEEKNDLDFSLNILVLGKTGVGKSATINSIFGEDKALINAFEPATTAVKEIVGAVDGVKIRVFDTPGLKSSPMDQGLNRRILSSIKKHTKSFPPDIVLYVDRLDSQTRDLNDLLLLKSISSSLGSSIWRNAIVTLTHGASAPPDGPSGATMSFDAYVAGRSHVVQQSIGQAVGDMRVMNPTFMNPVALVENHSLCRKNREGQKVLPNGSAWIPQLLVLCYSMKILSEIIAVSQSSDLYDHRKLFGFRARAPHLPYLLSWLLQSRAHPKLSGDQGGENADSDIDLDDLSDADPEYDEDEYDQLPPFKPLRKSQIANLSREQRKAYLEEYDYRVKLLQKKQWKEELRRMKEMKKGKVAPDDYGYTGEDFDQESGGPAAVPVPLPDMVLPPSFDSDNQAYRYRFLEPTSQFMARPVVDNFGWDHDCGYDGVNLEHSLAVVGRFPATYAVQIAKDKNEFTIHIDSSVSAKHGEHGSSMVGFDVQNVGKQLAYIVKGETKLKTWKKNKTTAGMTVTFLGENTAPGIKIEDQVVLGKRLVVVGSGGAVRCQGDAAYGANLEVRLREADFPIGQDQSTFGLSLVKWRGDLAVGANLLSQLSIGRSSKMAVRVALNNKMSGQISIRTSSSEHLQIGLMAIIPIAVTLYKNLWPGVGENYSIY